MAKQPDFLSKCEHWSERRAGFFQGVLGDVYDGALWNEMQYIDGRPFLALPNNLCLAMNIDWFNPYEDSPYSIGVVYMVAWAALVICRCSGQLSLPVMFLD